MGGGGALGRSGHVRAYCTLLSSTTVTSIFSAQGLGLAPASHSGCCQRGVERAGPWISHSDLWRQRRQQSQRYYADCRPLVIVGPGLQCSFVWRHLLLYSLVECCFVQRLFAPPPPPLPHTGTLVVTVYKANRFPLHCSGHGRFWGNQGQGPASHTKGRPDGPPPARQGSGNTIHRWPHIPQSPQRGKEISARHTAPQSTPSGTAQHTHSQRLGRYVPRHPMDGCAHP